MKQEAIVSSTSAATQYAEIGNQLRRERYQLHMTQKELAQLLGISVSYLGALERGERRLSSSMLIRLQEKLGITFDQLLYGNSSVPASLQCLAEPSAYQLRRELTLLLSACTQEECESCYYLIHTYLTHHRRSH